jgi:hypothetical protein
MIVALLSPEVREATTLEVYFSRTLGFTLLTLGILTVLLTGSVPLSSSLAEGSSPLHPTTYYLANTHRCLHREHRPQSAVRAPHAHHHRALPRHNSVLLLRPVDRDRRVLVRAGQHWQRFPWSRGAVVHSICKQQRQD